MTSVFIRVVNWERYQHYKTRNPPWVKLYGRLLTDRVWIKTDDRARVLAIVCMLLAAETGNKIPLDLDYIADRAYLEDVQLAPLIDHGFVELVHENGEVVSNQREILRDASKLLAQRKRQRQRQSKSKKQHGGADDLPRVDHAIEEIESLTDKNASNMLAEEVIKPRPSQTTVQVNPLRENFASNMLASDSIVERIAQTHPANWRAKGAMVIPPAHCDAVIRAIERDGEQVVLEGTQKYAEAVKRWPMDAQALVLGVVKFYNESHYLKDERLWERNSGKPNTQTERVARNRETILDAIASDAGETARPSGTGTRKRA